MRPLEPAVTTLNRVYACSVEMTMGSAVSGFRESWTRHPAGLTIKQERLSHPVGVLRVMSCLARGRPGAGTTGRFFRVMSVIRPANRGPGS